MGDVDARIGRGDSTVPHGTAARRRETLAGPTGNHRDQRASATMPPSN